MKTLALLVASVSLLAAPLFAQESPRKFVEMEIEGPLRITAFDWHAPCIHVSTNVPRPNGSAGFEVLKFCHFVPMKDEKLPDADYLWRESTGGEGGLLVATALLGETREPLGIRPQHRLSMDMKVRDPFLPVEEIYLDMAKVREDRTIEFRQSVVPHVFRVLYAPGYAKERRDPDYVLGMQFLTAPAALVWPGQEAFAISSNSTPEGLTMQEWTNLHKRYHQGDEAK